MHVTLKQMINGKWQSSQVDVSTLDDYQGKDAVAEIADGFLWCGTDKWYNHYAQKGYMVTTTTSLIEIMEHAKLIFSENREERRSICEADKVPEETIQHIFASQQNLYGEGN